MSDCSLFTSIMSSSCFEEVAPAQPASSPEGVVFRVLKATDLPHVRTLHRDLLPVSYPVAFFVQLLINPRQLCLVATERGTIVGFASAAVNLSPSLESSAGGCSRDVHSDRKCCSDIPQSRVTLLTLGVLPAYRRRGIGRSLVHGVVQRLQASGQDGKVTVLIQVQVAPSNRAGKCFYTHLGMVEDPLLCLGVGPRPSVMVGALCV